MTVEIKRTKKKNEVEVYRNTEYLGELFYCEDDKTYWISVGGSNTEPARDFFDFPTKEKAIGKMLHYYGYTK